jgi:ABC-type antimicrobial peptide transport system permease subunit
MPAIGLVAGAGLAAILARLMSSLLYKIAPDNPSALAAAAALLLLLSLISALLPLRRILKREPWSALQDE